MKREAFKMYLKPGYEAESTAFKKWGVGLFYILG